MEDAGKIISSDDGKIQRRITGKVVNPDAAAAYEKRQQDATKASRSKRSDKHSKKSSSDDKKCVLIEFLFVIIRACAAGLFAC